MSRLYRLTLFSLAFVGLGFISYSCHRDIIALPSTDQSIAPSNAPSFGDSTESVTTEPLEDISINELPDDDDFHQQVRFWADNFNYIPSTVPQFFQCQIQRNQITPPQWADLMQKTNWLKTHHDYKFDLADTYLLLHSELNQLAQPRDEIIDQIAHHLAPIPHTYRPASYPGAADDYCEDFVGRSDLFSYTDLRRIKLILSALTRPTTVNLLRQLLLEDMEDRASEVGGLCFLDNQEVRFQTYAPGLRGADNMYVESHQMLRDASLCISRWHCHADREKSFRLAGPGLDDLKFAKYYGTSLVIITYINARMMNIDFCTIQGEVVDLGNY